MFHRPRAGGDFFLGIDGDLTSSASTNFREEKDVNFRPVIPEGLARALFAPEEGFVYRVDFNVRRKFMEGVSQAQAQVAVQCIVRREDGDVALFDDVPHLEERPAYAKRLRALAKRAGIVARVTHFTKDVYVKVLPAMRQRLSGSLERLLSESTGNQPAHSEAPGVM